MPVISHHVSRLSQRIPLEFNEIWYWGIIAAVLEAYTAYVVRAYVSVVNACIDFGPTELWGFTYAHWTAKTKQTPWPLVRKRTIPTERPPLVDEI
jgi:hypothetical protein